MPWWDQQQRTHLRAGSWQDPGSSRLQGTGRQAHAGIWVSLRSALISVGQLQRKGHRHHSPPQGKNPTPLPTCLQTSAVGQSRAALSTPGGYRGLETKPHFLHRKRAELIPLRPRPPGKAALGAHRPLPSAELSLSKAGPCLARPRTVLLGFNSSAGVTRASSSAKIWTGGGPAGVTTHSGPPRPPGRSSHIQ